MPAEVEFQTKPQIALGQIERALGNGVRVAAWTFDELYGRDSKFLDGLQQRQQAFVAEVPELPGCMAHGSTYEAALAEAQEAISLWVDTATEFGDPIPEPKGRKLQFA